MHQFSLQAAVVAPKAALHKRALFQIGIKVKLLIWMQHVSQTHTARPIPVTYAVQTKPFCLPLVA